MVQNFGPRSDPSAVEVADVHVFDSDQFIAATAHRGGVFVAMLRGNESSDPMNVDSALIHYAIEGGEFREVERFEKDLSGEAPITGTPQNFVSDGTRAVVSTRKAIATVSVGRGDSPRIDRRIERGISDWGERDERDDRRYFGEHSTILSDGDYLEVYTGVSIWSFDRPEERSPLVGRTIIQEASSKRWDYASAVDRVYIFDEGYLSDPEIETDNYTRVIDVSDPAEPTLAAEWHSRDDFPNTLSTVKDVEVVDDRLYLSHSRSGRSTPPELDVLDISDPDTVDVIATYKVRELPLPEGHHAEYIISMENRGDTLYMRYKPTRGETPKLPVLPIVGIDRTALEE